MRNAYVRHGRLAPTGLAGGDVYLPGASLCLPPGTAALFQDSVAAAGPWACSVIISPGPPPPLPHTALARGLTGLPSHYSFCCLAEAAVAESLQHLESRVVVVPRLSGSQVYSGTAQDCQEKVIPLLS